MTTLLLGLLAFTSSAFAQSNDDDLFGSGSTVADERRAVQAGDLDDRTGVAGEIALPEEDRERRRIIKALPRKTFLKIGRWEAAPTLGFVTNDPFINRYLFGASVGHHVTEIFAVELQGGFSPDLGTTDWKPITHQLVENNQVSPDISKIVLYGHANFQFSPIYGKVAVMGRSLVNFDVYGGFGAGFVQTHDDLEALQATQDERALATAVQFHPTTTFGGGIRIIFNQNLAARLEGRSLVYVETIQSTTLEMKNNFLLTGSVALFFPRMN
jgi:outer membrane beta-barrel protein